MSPVDRRIAQSDEQQHGQELAAAQGASSPFGSPHAGGRAASKADETLGFPAEPAPPG
jgi:hypothetical protein